MPRNRGCYRTCSIRRPLRLRPFRLQDADARLSYATDPVWACYLPVPQPYTRADAEKFIAGQLWLDREVHPPWAIVQAGAVVGGINIRLDVAYRVGELDDSLANRVKPLFPPMRSGPDSPEV